MEALGLGQSELARRVGVAQPTIDKLIRSNKMGSKYLHKIARELGTSPAYLTGETDDPHEGAPPPAPPPRIQLVTMAVALPTEDALADAFEGVLIGWIDEERAELARELATQLPTLLRIAGGAAALQPRAHVSAAVEDRAAPAAARREPQRA